MTIKEKKLEKQVAALNKELDEVNKLNQSLAQTNLDLQARLDDQQMKFMQIFGDYLGLVEKEQEPPFGRTAALKSN